MSETQHFAVNFTSALRMLGKTPGGGILELRRGAGAFATGMPFAGENYALFDDCSSEEETARVLGFFEDRKLPFISMQIPELKKEVSEVLEKRGLSVRAEYNAMSMRISFSGREQDQYVKRATDKSGAAKWAEAAWTGFGGELPVPDSYNSFSAYLSSCPENHLYYLEREGTPLCSALLHSADRSCGLYYFATRPEARRQGLAARLMDSLADHASHFSENMVLLATEMGAKMYKSYGFTGLMKVLVLSGSDDI
ncbi:MAG: GNAT family N-acetyltransferase [Synergistaceae bacterium]|nr:GNAT family N-acetyltransferase [Synergistaceae bacterium]NLW61544.1 GNAT family N-acetyltransferase [Synergistaceae bacterium]